MSRRYFSQGLLLNYGFNHSGAVPSFRFPADDVVAPSRPVQLRRPLPPFAEQLDGFLVSGLVKIAVMGANGVEGVGRRQAHDLVA